MTLTDTARSIFAAALAACTVEQAFERITLPAIDADRILIVAAGKAAGTMLSGLLNRLQLPPDASLAGVLIAPVCPLELPEGIRYFAGGHPMPNAASFGGAKAALALVAQAPERAQIFFLISGGASAMMELPLDPAISLEDTVALYRALVHSGATIAEINCVRKHFSAVKGGRLGLAAASLANLTLLISDVPDGHLDALASGPTLPDTSTVAQCREILARYGLMTQFPGSVRRFFESANLPETPKPGDFVPRVQTLLSSAHLEEAAARKAESLGFTVAVDNTCDDWDYRGAAEYLIARLRELRRIHAKVCLISAGEVTVSVPPNLESPGVGGRNQHFALHAATLLDPTERLAILSAGSDGIDGNSPCAGAVMDQTSLNAQFRQSAEDALRRFDSGTFLTAIEATILTGPTGNNLRDLRLLLAE